MTFVTFLLLASICRRNIDYLASNRQSQVNELGHLIKRNCRRNIDYMHLASNSLSRMNVGIWYILVEYVEEISTTCI